MNSKEILICDTREKKNKSILKYFDKNNIDYITSKLNYGDYKIYKDNRGVIDRKDSLLEMAHKSWNPKGKRWWVQGIYIFDCWKQN